MGTSGKDRIVESYDAEVAEKFTAMANGMSGLPAYLGFKLTTSSAGRLSGSLPVKEEFLTPFGNMHGGVLAAACDHLLGCVCYPHMKPGYWAATTEFKINYLAPVTTGTVDFDAHLDSLTRSTAVIRIEAHNEERLVCIAQGTVLLREPKS